MPVLFSKLMVDTMTEERKEGIPYGGRRKAREKNRSLRLWLLVKSYYLCVFIDILAVSDFRKKEAQSLNLRLI